ncbi:MAG: DUF438 domain-containing protein [Zestosphaera sp.]
MSNDESKVELVKSLIRRLHEGARPEELSREFGKLLSRVSPFEIVLIEQMLVREGVPVSEVLRLCDLHVQLFREYLTQRVLEGVPEGHPLDMLVGENELILKWGEELGLHANIVLMASGDELGRGYEELVKVVEALKGLRLHYRKIQMLVFPYLERRGIVAVPRVLWGREDQVLTKVRELRELARKTGGDQEAMKEVARKALEVSKEVGELVFRENKVLFPAVRVLFTEGEWATIAEIAEEMGYLVPATAKWVPGARPVMPYEVIPEVSEEQLKALPPEFRELALKGLEVDTYSVKKEGDLELRTGFLSREEVEAIFESLPLEITYADENDRVRFFTKSKHVKGFVRTKTILGRRLLYCHPPRLEGMVRVNVERLKRGESELREYWTMAGDRIIRVIITFVRDEEGRYLGTLEIVEDLTEILRNPEEVMRKVVIL